MASQEISKMSEDYQQKNVIIVASTIGMGVLLLGLLGIWSLF